jgi:hypothetical protein
MWKLRAMTEEKLDEFAQQFGGGKEELDDLLDDDDLGEQGEVPPARARASTPAPSAREELERRLAESRARRRSAADYEEPLA